MRQNNYGDMSNILVCYNYMLKMSLFAFVFNFVMKTINYSFRRFFCERTNKRLCLPCTAGAPASSSSGMIRSC